MNGIGAAQRGGSERDEPNSDRFAVADAVGPPRSAAPDRDGNTRRR
jgi:hypothetical protein